MSDDTRAEVTDGEGASPFPSRRSIHASRIPSRQGSVKPSSPRPASVEIHENPVPSRPASSSPDSSQKRENATPVASTPASGSPFPTRRAHLTETGALALRQVGRKDRPSQVPESETGPAPESVGVAAKHTGTRRRRGGDGAPSPAPGANATPKSPPMSSSSRPRVPVQVKAKRTPAWRVALIMIIVLGLIGGAAFLAWRSLAPGSTPTITESIDFPGPGEGSVEVTVTSGEVGSQIGQSLVDAGVVKTVEGFVKAFDATAAASTIKPGTYTLRKGMTSAAALAALLDEGNRRDNAITVNAGQTAEQVFAKMISVGGFSQEAIDTALEDPQALGLPEAADGNVEGWLGVGSYDFGTDVTAVDALSTMIERTKTTLTDLGVPETDWEDVLIKASILEREAGLESDMPKVARVIANRLEQPEAETRGLLQMDSTVLYGVGKYGGLPTSEDLGSDSPYNTYKVKGLPPTPIASPSTAAIEATINPDEGDWLYFVTVNLDTGETLFAPTLAEQTKNIEKLNAWCAANEGRC